MRDNLITQRYKENLKSTFNIAPEEVEELAFYGHEIIDELYEEMNRIKILGVATHVMEMTRMLPNNQKKALKSFCDKIV